MVFVIPPGTPSWKALLYGMVSAAIAGALSYGIFYLSGNPDPVLPLGGTAVLYGVLQSAQTYLRNKGII